MKVNRRHPQSRRHVQHWSQDIVGDRCPASHHPDLLKQCGQSCEIVPLNPVVVPVRPPVDTGGSGAFNGIIDDLDMIHALRTPPYLNGRAINAVLHGEDVSADRNRTVVSPIGGIGARRN